MPPVWVPPSVAVLPVPAPVPALAAGSGSVPPPQCATPSAVPLSTSAWNRFLSFTGPASSSTTVASKDTRQGVRCRDSGKAAFPTPSDSSCSACWTGYGGPVFTSLPLPWERHDDTFPRHRRLLHTYNTPARLAQPQCPPRGRRTWPSKLPKRARRMRPDAPPTPGTSGPTSRRTAKASICASTSAPTSQTAKFSAPS